MNREINKTKEQLIAELEKLRNESKNQAKKLLLQNKELDTKVLRRTKELEKSEHHYKMLFNESPVPIWEEDFSQCKTYIDTLKKRNIKNIREYFDNHPNEIIEAISKLIIIDVNKAAIKLHEAKSKQELLHSFLSIFTDKSYEAVKEQLICIAKGINEYETESVIQTIAGIEKTILLKWKVVPGYEETLEKVYVTTIDITKHKQSQELLRKSEDRFNSVANASPDGIGISDLNGIIEYVAPQTIAMWGYSKEEFIGKHIHEVIHERSHATVHNMISELLKGNNLGALEYEMVRKDGTIFTCEANCSLLYDENNKPNKVLYIQRDITERKKAEDKLKESEDRLYKAMLAAKDGMWDWNLETNEVYFDKRYYQMAGYEPNEFPHRFEEFQKRIHPDDVNLVLDNAQKHLNGETERFIVEFRFKKKNGDWLWIIGRGLIVERDEDKKPLQFIGTHTDISERKKTEEALKSSLQQIEIINANTPNIIWKTEIDKQINFKNTYISEVADEFLSLPKGTINNNMEKFLSYIHPDYLPQIKDIFQKAIANPGQILSLTYEVIKRDGNKVWLTSTGRIKINNNKVTAYGTTVDITNRKLAEIKLEEKERKYRELSTLMHLMANNMPDMLWAKNLKKEFIFVNKSICTGLLNAKDTDEPLGKTDMFFSSRERNSHPHNPEWHTFGELCMDSDTVTLEAMKPMRFDEYGNVKGKFLFLDMYKAPLYDADGKLIGTVGSARDITIAKEAETKLRKLSTAVTQSPAAIMITDTKGKLEYVNPKFTEITGYSREEVIGQNTRILQSGEHSNEMYKELWQTVSSGKIWQGEMHNKKKNGELFWTLSSISPIFDEKGEIINYVDVAEDITERKRNEETQKILLEISKTTNQYNSLFDFLEIIHQKIKSVLRADNFYVALYNQDDSTYSFPYHSDEIDNIELNKPYDFSNGLTDFVFKSNRSMIITPNDHEKMKNNAIKGYGDIKSVWLGVPLKHSDQSKPVGVIAIQDYKNIESYTEGDRAVFEIIAYHIFGFIQRIKYLEDIIAAKEKAEESEYKVRSMFKNTQIGIIYCNAKGDILEANPTILDILGSPSMEATSNINILTFKPLQEVGFAKNVKKCISEKIIISEDTLYTSKWGKTIFMKYYLVPVIVNNKVKGVWINLNNLTNLWNTQNQLKEAKEKAEESDRLKSAFLANMSHEIRTPMNGILGFADLLKEPDLSGVELQSYVEIIEKSGKRMLNIINDIVDISKIESGLMEFHTKETKVNEQLEYISTFFKPEAESKGIELYFKNNYIAKEIIIKTDREKLYAILTNLVKNAIKYTNEGSIEFGYNLKRSNRAAELEFYVKDTGIGVPKDKQKAIFERFMQAEIDDKMARQGAGLGLAITKAYVEKLGGKIWVESNENKRTDGMEGGSIFYFTLPYNPDEKTENDKQDVILKNNKTMRKLKILVAEDDKVSEMLLNNFIKTFSREILHARTGIEAVESCRNNPDIDLVLMDIRMPKMDGYKATKLIREFNKELIIIAQTAYGLAGDREKAIDAGCNDYISKPINITELQTMIQKYFGK